MQKCQIAVHIGDAVNVINGITCAGLQNSKRRLGCLSLLSTVFTVLRAKALSKRWWIVVPLVALACLLNPALFLVHSNYPVMPSESLSHNHAS